MNQPLYSDYHFEFLKNRLTNHQLNVMITIGENQQINKTAIISKSPHSKMVVTACIDALYLTGLIDRQVEGRQNIYVLSDEGQRFVDYLLHVSEEGER